MLRDCPEMVLQHTRIAFFPFDYPAWLDFHRFSTGSGLEERPKVRSKLICVLSGGPARWLLTSGPLGRPSRQIFSLRRAVTLPENRPSLVCCPAESVERR